MWQFGRLTGSAWLGQRVQGGKGEAGEEQMSVKTDLGHLEVGGRLCLGQPAQDPLLCPFPKWRNQ